MGGEVEAEKLRVGTAASQTCGRLDACEHPQASGRGETKDGKS